MVNKYTLEDILGSFKHMADDFANHFKQIVDNIRDATQNSPPAVI